MDRTIHKKMRREARKNDFKKSVTLLKNPVFIFILLFLIINCFLILFQIYWGVITAFKTQSEFRRNLFGLPKEWCWQNFVNVWENFDIKRASEGVGIYYITIWEQLYNTVFYCVVSTLMEVLVPSCVGYAIASFKYKFNAFIIAAYWFSVIYPATGTQAAQLYIFRVFGLFDNLYGFSIVSRFTFLSLSTLIFRGAFSGVSSSYREAGIIDGASEFTCMFRLAIPLVYPYLLVCLIRSFVVSWENYTTILIYLPSYPTLAVGVYRLSLSVEPAVNSIHTKLAGCVMMSIPIAILYWFNRSKILVNLNVGGIKG